MLLLGLLLTGKMVLLVLAAAMLTFNLIVNRRLLSAFRRSGGLSFALVAALYYLLLYPLAVGAGAGMLRHARSSPARPQEDR